MSKEHRDPEMDARLMDWAETRTIASTDDGASPSFEVLAEQRRRARHHTRVRQGVLLAAAAALLFVALPENTPPTAQSLPTPDPVALDVPNSPPVMAESVTDIENPDPTLRLIHAEGEFATVADEAQVDADGRILLALGEDRIGLGTAWSLAGHPHRF